MAGFVAWFQISAIVIALSSRVPFLRSRKYKRRSVLGISSSIGSRAIVFVSFFLGA